MCAVMSTTEIIKVAPSRSAVAFSTSLVSVYGNDFLNKLVGENV